MPEANIFLLDSAPLLDKAALSFYLPQIEKGRQENVRRAKGEKERALRLAAGLLLSHFLGTYPIKREPLGKPIAIGGPHFSLSHSGRFAALAIGSCALGLDVQEIISYREKIAERFFHAEEIAYLKRCPDEKKAAAFCRLWALKEAQCKATGLGMARGFASCAISCLPQGVKALAKGKVLPFHFYEYELGDYKIALCSAQALSKKPALKNMSMDILGQKNRAMP